MVNNIPECRFKGVTSSWGSRLLRLLTTRGCQVAALQLCEGIAEPLAGSSGRDGAPLPFTPEQGLETTTHPHPYQSALGIRDPKLFK